MDGVSMKIDKFGLIVTIWMCFFLAVVLSILLPIISTGSVTLAVFLEGLIISFVISLIISLIIPLMDWGGKVAAAAGAKPGTLPWHLVSTAVLTLIMATLLSLIMVYYFLPATARMYFLTAWLGVYPFVLLGIYVSALVAAPIGVAIAKRCTNIPA